MSPTYAIKCNLHIPGALGTMFANAVINLNVECLEDVTNGRPTCGMFEACIIYGSPLIIALVCALCHLSDSVNTRTLTMNRSPRLSIILLRTVIICSSWRVFSIELSTAERHRLLQF